MSPDVFEEIEERRGLISRSAYIEYGLKQYLKLREFYGDLLAMLPKEVAGEDCDKLRSIVEDIRAKVEDRRKEVQP